MAANEPNQLWCSRCTNFRDWASFETNKLGQKRKLCNRHEKKRELKQTLRLDIKRVFNVDNLPVGFASLDDDSTTDRAATTNAVSELVEIIWKKGGFRFRHRTTNQEKCSYMYFCFQDAQRTRNRQSATYLSQAVCRSPAFRKCIGIRARTAISTPAETYRDLQAAQLPGWDLVTSHQVYYQWQQLNSKIWHRDQDALRSAQILLSDHQECTSLMHFSGNMRTRAFYISDSIKTLVPRVKELAIDATFGTNNMGMHLFAVLAEVDGTGISLAYCFMDVFKDNSKGVRQADPGATTSLLEQFLRPLCAAGFNPIFFGTDKDLSEIAAIRQIWPETTIQLCYWHARRAIRMKFASSRKINTQDAYKPSEAQKAIPDLEICWGSLPTRRPDGNHRYGRCDCQSRLTNITPQSRIEIASGDEQNTVLDIFSRHFSSHPLIPDQNGIYRSAERIYRDCAAEMYDWCRSKGYFRLWSYLWVNWYQPDQWYLWARSINEKKIPIPKTTMVVESHWRKIKHDYLHRFNRPRIDLVIWVLLSRLVPNAMARMQTLLQCNHCQATAS
ncbi:hypothetical protein DM02DRAFT_688395 [Periconia macrospinosa]|uniref:MULE transposase domain-containing protein n=1 Tax=Periconia macrospinosa TaxID=97972 RepID=A0A2V1DDT0_9PLEO|nr:hypothetical protein DM02DRAFT_688395 [Periconia macrospinosa]